MSPGLAFRVEELQADFCKVTGKRFKHFFCPILLTDEPGELCKGHVIPEAFGNAWVPQRRDVDHFYGSATEADCIGFLQDKGTDVMANWHKPSIQKRFKPRLEIEGKPIEYYFTQKPVAVPGQTFAQFVDKDGTKLANLMLKLPPEHVIALADRDLQLVVERDLMPAFIGSILKAAHLSMFVMLGYEYVFTSTGLYIADILRRFYFEGKDDNGRTKREAANEYFMPFRPMVFPMEGDAATEFAGTVNDNRGVMCIGMSDRPFAIGVVVKMSETFCALFPPDRSTTLETYLGFLKLPPGSIRLRNFSFRPNDGTEGYTWELSQDYRVALPHVVA